MSRKRKKYRQKDYQHAAKNDYQIVNGKPHLGIYLGRIATLESNELTESEIQDKASGLINEILQQNPSGCEIRHHQVIYKPPHYSNPLISYATIGLKYMLWGRAYKIKKLLRISIGHKKRKKWPQR